MDFGATLSAAWAAIELAALNLLLGADNAVVVALACRPLPASLRKSALIIGVSSAILLRFGLATLVNALVVVPGVRLAAAAFLLWVAVGIIANQQRARGALKEAETAPPIAATASFWTTVLVVIGADVVVSLDNVVALVSVSQGNVTLLILGLALSVPALIYGTLLLTKMFDEWPALVLWGAVLLGWIAGQMAASDASISAWVIRQAPALTVVVPVLCAAYVYLAAVPRMRGQSH